MKKEPQQIIDGLKTIRPFQPSLIRNSLAMYLTQIVSFAGAISMIGCSIYTYIQCCPQQAYLMLVIALLLLVIWKLTYMVRTRNNYIHEVNHVVDGDD